MPVVTVTDANFDSEVLKSDLPVLVDFWAAWCGPCRMVAPIIEELSGDYSGKVKFAKIDVDANPQKASQFNIRSIPNMIVFRGGRAVDSIVGAMPKAAIAQRLDAAITR
jgi:thioredoxin 1